MRTGTRCASRAEWKVGLTLASRIWPHGQICLLFLDAAEEERAEVRSWRRRRPRAYGEGSDVPSPCSQLDHAIDRAEIAVAFVERPAELGAASSGDSSDQIFEGNDVELDCFTGGWC
jgi:hypothetical protein